MRLHPFARAAGSAVVSLALLALSASVAHGKGVGVFGLPAPGGVTVPDSKYRFSTVSPGFPAGLTVITRTELRGGRISRWWYLPRSWQVPAVAMDGSPGGLSADGSTLILSNSPMYRSELTRFAVLDTGALVGRRSGPPFEFLTLRGRFSFDAIAPDGSTLYLIRYLSARDPTLYEVRAFDLKRNRLLPKPVIDPSEPAEQMTGLPLTRESSLDGRWAYTLYRAREPFVHALDTVGRRAVCIDLPQLQGRPDLELLELRVAAGGDVLQVAARPREYAKRPMLRRRIASRPLPVIDTRTFDVTTPEISPASTSSGAPAWWLIAAGVAGFAASILLAGGLLPSRRGPLREQARPPRGA